ncbi:helix-turn-helix transcriptional regulator [Brasilonema sp. CT11]|nr:helix-turn-helix transcriptional regulator [Brasilonema sp. CT11]
MTITLTQKENSELWAEAEMNSLQNSEPDEFVCQMPKLLGKGYVREIEVHSHLLLSISNYESHEDLLIKIPQSDHRLQFNVLLSGKAFDEYGGQLGEGYTLISGSGVQRKMTLEIPKSRYVGVEIELPPDLLTTFFPDEDGQIPRQLRLLAKGQDWQTLIYPQITTAIQGVAQQIVSCPYKGMMKRMYLQGKVIELMALQLGPIFADHGGLHYSPRLKPATIARIDYAREILLSRLENPPSIVELAQLVGVSTTTLKRGFTELFGTTVFRYITDKRMEWAEQLLRQGNTTVAEIANKIGYSNPGHFAAAFKCRFGITPSQCLMSKKVLLGS